VAARRYIAAINAACLGDIGRLAAAGENPVWRIAWKPFGSTWMSTRRMNSAGASDMVV